MSVCSIGPRRAGGVSPISGAITKSQGADVPLAPGALAAASLLLAIPASLEATTVSIMSRLNTLFNWVEVNAVAEDWHAHVAAIARLWVAYDGEFRQTPPAQFVNLLAMPKEVKTHQNMASLAPSAALAMQLEVSPGSGTTLTIYESIELVATTPNGHAYVDGIFAWEPVAVQVREG